MGAIEVLRGILPSMKESLPVAIIIQMTVEGVYHIHFFQQERILTVRVLQHARLPVKTIRALETPGNMVGFLEISFNIF